MKYCSLIQLFFSFICKKKSNVVPYVKCPEGWASDGKGKCYFVSSETVPHQTAVDRCPLLAHKSELFRPKSYEQTDFVLGNVMFSCFF